MKTKWTPRLKRKLTKALEIMCKDLGSNQCDGCRAGIPIVNGIHQDKQVMGMYCTKNRYKEP